MNSPKHKTLVPVTVTGLTWLSFTFSQVVSASPIEIPIDTTGLSEPIEIVYGSHTVNAGISPGDDVDGYRFTGRAGDSVRLVLASNTPPFDALIELRDPTGAILQTQSCDGISAIETCSTFLDQTLTTTGTYFANIADVGSNEPGNYVLDLEQYPPVNNWVGVGYDSTFSTELGHKGDHDFLAFSGDALTGVRINVTGITPGLDPSLQVWDPTGDLIAEDNCVSLSSLSGCSFFSDLDLTEAGIYRLSVAEVGFNLTGTYNIRVSCTYGVCPSEAPSAVPVPAAVWLFGSGLLGLIGIARRKKAA